MKRIILLLSIIIPICLYSNETDKKDIVQKGKDEAIYSKPFAKITKAKGWWYDGEQDQWIGDSNIIGNIDNFKSYEFGFVTFGDKRYLYFTKEYLTENSFWFKKESQTYILDIDEYKEATHEISPIRNTFAFRALANEFSKKPQSINLDENTNYSVYLVFKFGVDVEKNIVQFLIYDESQFNARDEIYRVSKSSLNSKYNDVETYGELGLYITAADYPDEYYQTDLMYENFYYEMDFDKFLDFITSPFRATSEEVEPENEIK
ncbi:hypothetical protein [Dysgonomonas sp. ZJ279]|uniref:hypothetical protein n=1 Tax=Dysgonomonas sp. ZJ279 TaxID=2709796 RepID=UPI0013EDAFF1|nr:hypothetical protein [Dysgonomonas sp. ZJ279]